jgi:hypothetical protein
MSRDVIANSLNMTPMPAEEKVEIDTVDDDYDFARKNLRDVIHRGASALEDIIDIAQQSESPRAYEVVSTLIGQITDANKKLLELAAQKKKLKDEKQSDGPSTVNNNLFVGNSTELLKMLKAKANE